MTPKDTHGERILRLEVQQEAMRDDIHAIRADVRMLRDALLQGKGSWKTAASLFGVAAAIAISLVTAWLMSWFGPRGD